MILASQQVRTGEGLAGHLARAAHFIYGETKAQGERALFSKYLS